MTEKNVAITMAEARAEEASATLEECWDDIHEAQRRKDTATRELRSALIDLNRIKGLPDAD